MLRPFESLNILRCPAIHTLSLSTTIFCVPLLSQFFTFGSAHIPFPHAAAPCFYFVCQFLIQHNLFSSFLFPTYTHHRWISFTLFHISVPRGLILLFSLFSTHLWPSSSTFLLFHITAGSAFLLSSLKLSHLSPSSFPNPFLPTDFQILLPFHYFVFPPPSPPSWASYQHFFCTLSSTSTSSSPYHGAGAHQGSTGESLPFIFSSI